MLELAWLPTDGEWSSRFAELGDQADLPAWERLRALARVNLPFSLALRLDRALLKRFTKSPPPGLATRPVRLALLGTSTTEHLQPGIRLGCLRRNLWVEIYSCAYGQYLQELLDPSSALHAFKPDVVLLALDASHLFGSGLTADSESSLQNATDKIRSTWKTAAESLGCRIIQQTPLATVPALLGQNEQRLPVSVRRLTFRLNEMLRPMADEAGVDLLALDDRVASDGLAEWHDVALWHKAKQEVRPSAAPLYGDLVARLLAARQGLSAKCLVLDLDNTIWGGVIGDDGLEGITLGQGSALGEAFLSVQRYALALTRRGIILAVCSKNDEANALLPFDKHPDMILKRDNIACFVANWSDKATNLREISRRLNIGLDALVFLDDNPFERNLVRQELPMVSVPELPEDPALYAQRVADAGYFEAVALTEDDLQRTQQYQANLARDALRAEATDLDGYLRGLAMEMQWAPFDRVNLARIVQLINKTNQFNLTTRRYTEAEVLAVMENPRALTLQLRLLDRFGDNGIIGIIIGRPESNGQLLLDTWLMSCRVLGRGVEQATLALIGDEARRLGFSALIGEYLPTAKNSMVKEHYGKLGFTADGELRGGGTRWTLDMKSFTPPATFIKVTQATS